MREEPQPRNRQERRLFKRGKFEKGHKFFFYVVNPKNDCTYYWKVENSHHLDRSKWRGEITEGHTKNQPEILQYDGVHTVTCFEVKDSRCIHKGVRQVELDRDGAINATLSKEKSSINSKIT